jgi:hypothetical protein
VWCVWSVLRRKLEDVIVIGTYLIAMWIQLLNIYSLSLSNFEFQYCQSRLFYRTLIQSLWSCSAWKDCSSKFKATSIGLIGSSAIAVLVLTG